MLKDGRRFETAVPWPAGSLAVPFTDAQLWAKFDGCAARVLPPERARRAPRRARGDLPRLPSIAPLTAPLY